MIRRNLPGVTLAVENLPYQQEVQSRTLPKTSFILPHRGSAKKLWTEILSTGKRTYEIIISTKKEKGENTGFFVHQKFFRGIEFCLNTKCLVSSHSYTLLFQECIIKAKRLFHGIRLSIFYEPNSVQVALKIPS